MEEHVSDLISVLIEALNRDASELDIIAICRKWEQNHNLHPSSRFGIDYNKLQLQFPSYPRLSSLARDAVQVNLTREFRGLPQFIRASFNRDPPKDKKLNFQNELAHYFPIRKAMYVAGYDLPEHFSSIQPITFLGKNVIGGLHLDARQKLQTVEKTLGAASEDIRSAINDIAGFVPRLQDNSKKLSNHAAGLAIDINTNFNPDIGGIGSEFKRADELFAIKEITGYDFGEKKKNISIERLYADQKAASDKLRGWLREHLHERKTGNTQPKLYSLLGEQQPTNYHLLGEMEPTSVRLTSQSLLNLLRKSRSDAELLDWEQFGIVSLPLILIKAMIDAGFIWGGTFGNHKDFMHFQLDKALTPRPLKEIDYLPMSRAFIKPSLGELLLPKTIFHL